VLLTVVKLPCFIPHYNGMHKFQINAKLRRVRISLYTGIWLIANCAHVYMLSSDQIRIPIINGSLNIAVKWQLNTDFTGLLYCPFYVTQISSYQKLHIFNDLLSYKTSQYCIKRARGFVS
jgi:hypothetical protein